MLPEVTKQEARKLWIAALRSGDYVQDTDHPVGGTGWCPLLVACEVAKRAGVDVGDYSGKGDLEFAGGYRVMAWLGLKTAQGWYSGHHSLIADNDGGKSFDAIADIVESEPEGLFEDDDQ